MLLPGALRADSLEQIFQRMDQAAKTFKSVSAKVHRVNYTAVIQETSGEDAELRLRKGKNGLQGVVQFTDGHTIGFDGHKVRVYYPKMNQVQIYDLGKNASQLDQFILLSFGAAGSDLAKSYSVKLAGADPVNSKKTNRLELTPKSEEARKFATLVELWIEDGTADVVKEKVTEPSKDYIESTYSDRKTNPPLPDSAFELKLPPGVKTVTAK